MPARLFDTFVNDVCAGKTNETPISYRRKLRALQDWIGKRNPCSLTLGDLHEFQRYLLRRDKKKRGGTTVCGKLSPWTVRSTLVTVKHFYKWLYQRGEIEDDIAAEFRVPQPPPPEPKPVTETTVTALLHAALRMNEQWEVIRNLAFIYCLRDTGGRLGSILGVSVNNVNLNEGEILTNSKGRTGTLYLNPPTVMMLRAWLDARRELDPKTDRLFIGRYGRPLTRSGAYWILKRLANLAGVHGERFNPHAFRHAFVRDALKSRKADLSQASRLLWHTSIRVTADYYARWDDAELKRVHAAASPGMALPDPFVLLYGE